MTNLLYLVIILLLSLLFATVFTLVYMFIYQKKIASRLAKAERNKKEMPVPFHFFLCSFAALILLLLVTLMFTQVNTTTLHSESNEKAELVPCDAAGITSLLNPDSEIPGYQRNEQVDGSFRFVIYIKAKNYTDPFPRILMYISSDKSFSCDYVFANVDNSSVEPITVLTASQWFAVSNNTFPSNDLSVICKNEDGDIGKIVVLIH